MIIEKEVEVMAGRIEPDLGHFRRLLGSAMG